MMIIQHRTFGLIAGVLGLLVLSACGKRESAKPSAPVESTSEMGSEPLAPPSQSAQIEQRLIELGAEQSEGGLLVTLASAQFQPGQTDFQLSDTTRIDLVTQLLGERPELRVKVIGHTDSRGSEATNIRVSRQRAEAVRQMLVERGSIDAQRIDVEGKGEAQPIASNTTAEGRQQNRRVELIVADKMGRFASGIKTSPAG